MKKLSLILLAAWLCGSFLYGQSGTNVYFYRGGGALESFNGKTRRWERKQYNDTLHGTSVIRSKGNFFLWHDGVRGTYQPCTSPCAVSAARLTCVIEDYDMPELPKKPAEVTGILPLLRETGSASGHSVGLMRLESGFRLVNRSDETLYVNVLRLNQDGTCTPLFCRRAASGEKYYLVKMPKNSVSEVPAGGDLPLSSTLILLTSPDPKAIAPADELLKKIISSRQVPDNAGISVLQ